MATLLGALSYRMVDSSGVVTNKDEYFTCADTKTLAEIQAFADLYAPLLDALTEAKISKQTVRFTLPTSGLKDTPVSDSDVQETLLLNWALSTSFYSYGDDVPGVIDAVIVNGRVDISQTNLVDYTTFQKAVHSGITPTSEFSIALVALNSATETFRKKRKQLNARSKTIVR